MNETHWYYPDTIPYTNGIVVAACGKRVHYERECNLRMPTCPDCKEAKEDYDSLQIN